MKLTTFIVEDTEKQYNRISDQLSNTGTLNVISRYLGEQPFDAAVKAINKEKPHLLVIDWDLEDPDNRKGEQLLAYIEPYPYFIFFCSTYTQAVNKTQPKFANSVFFLKEPAIHFFPEDELKEAIKIAQEYLHEVMTVRLKFYKDGKSGGGRDNIMDRDFLCKDIISLSASGKQFDYAIQDKNSIKIYSGPCEKSSDIQKLINEINYPKFIEVSLNPYTVVNELHYDHVPNSHIYKVRPEYKNKLNNVVRIDHS